MTANVPILPVPLSPTVSYTPQGSVGEWVFTLHAGGREQKLRTTELVALYRDCDTALVAHRRAVTG